MPLNNTSAVTHREHTWRFVALCRHHLISPQPGQAPRLSILSLPLLGHVSPFSVRKGGGHHVGGWLIPCQPRYLKGGLLPTTPPLEKHSKSANYLRVYATVTVLLVKHSECTCNMRASGSHVTTHTSVWRIKHKPHQKSSTGASPRALQTLSKHALGRTSRSHRGTLGMAGSFPSVRRRSLRMRTGGRRVRQHAT